MTFTRVISAVLISFLSVFASATVMTDDDAEREVREQAARMLIVGFRGDTIGEDVRHYVADLGVGGVILFDSDLTSGGGHGTRNIRSPRQLKSLCDRLKRLAGSDLLIAVDEEGGKVSRLKHVYGFPSTVSAEYMGERNDSAFTTAKSYAVAGTLRDAGININFAPSVDVNVNPACPVIGRLGRSFSSDPSVVADNAAWSIMAHHRRGIMTAIKHFPGHGSSRSDSHFGMTDVTDTWTESELIPFRRLIDSGLADVVMTAHIYNANLDSLYPATLSHNVIDGILRNQLNFDGVVMTDDMYMEAIVNHYTLSEAVIRAINAGCDMLILGNNSPSGYFPGRPNEVIDIIVNAVLTGEISRERLDESARRIDDLFARLRRLAAADE